MKKAFFVIVIAVSILALYEFKYGYKKFTIVDVTKENVIYHQSEQSVSFLKFKIRGEINGNAKIFLRACVKSETKENTDNILLTIPLQGKIDTTLSHEFYLNHLCTEYKPNDVKGGDLTIWISLR